jgi:hypothetical protein
MSEAARVRSVGSLHEARSALQRFALEAGHAMAEVDAEVQRTIHWLRGDRVAELQREIRRCEDVISNAKGEVYKKELTSAADPPSLVEERKAVEAARRRLEESRARLEATKRWVMNLDREWVLFKGQCQGLIDAVQRDIPLGVARLNKMIGSLEAYARIAPPDGSGQAPAEGVIALGDSLALEPAAPTSLGERARLLRRGTPGLAARAGIELTDEPLGVGGSILPVAEAGLLKRLGLAGGAVGPGEKVVVADGCVGGATLYLERLAGAGEGDSGWYIGPGENAAHVGSFSGVTVRSVLAAAPGLAAVLSLPAGYLVMFAGAGVEAVLGPDDRVLLEGGR